MVKTSKRAMFAVGNLIISNLESRIETRLVSVGETKSIFDSNHYVGKTPSTNHPSTFYAVGHQNDENANMSASVFSAIKADLRNQPEQLDLQRCSPSSDVIYKSFFSQIFRRFPIVKMKLLPHSPLIFPWISGKGQQFPMGISQFFDFRAVLLTGPSKLLQLGSA